MSDHSNNPARTWHAPRPHRIALATAPPRTFAFFLIFGLHIWVALIRGEGWSLILSGLILVLWPGIALAHAALASNSKKAEFTNLYIDCLLFGVWCAVLDFYVWATFLICTACLMNNMVIGGPRRALTAGATLTLGAVAGGTLSGFAFQPYVGIGPDVFMSAGALIYFMGVGHTMYGQNRKLGRNIVEIQNKNRVFHSLLDLGVIAYRARDIDRLLEASLEHLSTTFPEYGFAVFLKERENPEAVRHVAARGMPPELEHRLTDIVADLSEEREGTFQVDTESADQQLFATSMANRLSIYDGWLVVRAPMLTDALERMLTLFVDQLAAATENKLLHQALQAAAERDGLTGLYNRGFFESELQRSVHAKAHWPGQDFTVLMVDVDGLKEVNDRLGHVVGDKLIITVAEELLEHCRDGDIIARYGGDEFVFLFPAAGPAAARRMAGWIRTNLEGQHRTITTASGEHVELVLRLSLGNASSTETSPQEVLTLADNRMYEDKTKRRTSAQLPLQTEYPS